MKRTGRKKEWSIALFGFSLLVFFPPILSIFDKPILTGGIPLQYLFLFGIWLFVIIAMAIGARRRQPPTEVEGELPTLDGQLSDFDSVPSDNDRNGS